MPWYTSPIFVIIMFYGPPVLSLLILFFIKRNCLYLSVPITAIIDMLFWGYTIINGGSYAKLVFVFLIPKWVFLLIISFVIMTVDKILNKNKF